MATDLYLTGEAAPYTPATIRGAWDASGSAVTKGLDELMHGAARVRLDISESSTTNNWDVLMYRGVSGKLGAQTISGTLNVFIAVGEDSASMNAFYHVHLYVTQGDSDTPRGTLLTDYIDSSEWAFSNGSGKALVSAQTLSSLAVSDGDRLVLEIGYQAQNTSATVFTGRLHYGNVQDAPKVAAGDDGLGSNAFVTFSNTLTWSTTALQHRVSQLRIGAVYQHTSVGVRVSQVRIGVLRSNAGAISVGQKSMSKVFWVMIGSGSG